jgi:hypothetical protein
MWHPYNTWAGLWLLSPSDLAQPWTAQQSALGQRPTWSNGNRFLDRRKSGKVDNRELETASEETQD